MSYTKDEIIVPRNVEEEVKESYLRYSMSVIISRALPDVRDGLKPSQRRILYAMRQLNLSPGGKHRKCAKISRRHLRRLPSARRNGHLSDPRPHGPSTGRCATRLVDGQGNFGSVDGDPPAAMRYTEARLTHASMALMEDLDKDTVDLVPNYDETKTEPTVFPRNSPTFSANGSSGIAVGMATNIPPHNLGELITATLLVLDNPQTTIDQIMEVMPAPDFPTGGVICGYRGIKEAYHTGRGKMILRGVIRVEDMEGAATDSASSSTRSPTTSTKSTLDQADRRPRQRKDDHRHFRHPRRIGQRWHAHRASSSSAAKSPTSRSTSSIKYTDLQVTFGCNMLALDKGLPRTMNIKQFIAAWIDHRIEVVRRRTRFELAKAEARAHILEGYLKALDHLDAVVKLIRASANRDAARAELMAAYGLTERQANAVLDLRLYQLTGLEREKIEAEYKELLAKDRPLPRRSRQRSARARHHQR